MAWNYRPIRAEPLYQVSKLYRMINQPRLAYLYACMAKTMPYPKFDILFIDEDVYKWQIDDEIASTAFYLHKFDDGISACRSLLENPLYPEQEKPRMQQNLALYQQKMQEMGHMVSAMRDMENSKPQTPKIDLIASTLDKQKEEDDRRDRLKKLLNRKKDRKAKSR